MYDLDTIIRMNDKAALAAARSRQKAADAKKTVIYEWWGTGNETDNKFEKMLRTGQSHYIGEDGVPKMAPLLDVQLDGEEAPFYEYYRLSPVCRSCIYFQGLMRCCAAFPEGIPVEIWTGINLHRAPFTGDRGIQFTPWEPSDSMRIERWRADQAIQDFPKVPDDVRPLVGLSLRERALDAKGLPIVIGAAAHAAEIENSPTSASIVRADLESYVGQADYVFICAGADLDRTDTLLLDGLGGKIALKYRLDAVQQFAGRWIRQQFRLQRPYFIEGHNCMDMPSSVGKSCVGFFQDRHAGTALADLQLIEKSLVPLATLARRISDKTIVCEFPGVAHGLAEEQVAPLLQNVPDNLTFVLPKMARATQDIPRKQRN